MTETDNGCGEEFGRTNQMNQGATKSVSSTIVQRTLLRMGLRSRGLVNAPMQTDVHGRLRLELARQYRNWTSTECRQVTFTYESRFMLHQTDGCWHETSENKHPATTVGGSSTTQPKVAGHGTGVGMAPHPCEYLPEPH